MYSEQSKASVPVTPEVISLAFATRRGIASLSEAEQAFIQLVLQDWRAEELPGLDADDLAVALSGLWDFASASLGLEATARITPAVSAAGQPLGLDLLEIVQPDGPFLVDSVMAEVGEAVGNVVAMFHPIVDLGWGRRSMIQVWLSPLGEERRQPLVEGLLAALSDVAKAVSDLPGMLTLLSRTVEELEVQPAADPEALSEAAAFLRWLEAGHFIFLGTRVYEYPRTADGGYASEEPLYQPEASLGVLRDPTRAVLRRANEPAVLTASLRRGLELADPVVVAKSNLRSHVHRRVFMDYVGVLRYGTDGRPAGEVRFVGLFTSEAHDEPARETPFLRRKLAQVMRTAGFVPRSHNARRLAAILESLPRSELFQTPNAELLTTGLGILHLFDRPKIKLFVRRDPWDRFISVLFYAPRDRYDARLRTSAGERIADAFCGRVSAYYPVFSDAPLARVQFIIELAPGEHPSPDLNALESDVALLARTWDDDLEAAVRGQSAEPKQVPQILLTWQGAFPPGYRERYDGDEAFTDLSVLGPVADERRVCIRAFRTATDGPLLFRCKIYQLGTTPIALARVLPIFQDMGLSALSEESYSITPLSDDGQRRQTWIHEFILQDENGERLSFADIKMPFEAAFIAVWDGQLETDRFNRLVMEIGASPRQAALIRALARYRQQSGLDPSPAVQQSAVAEHPDVTRLILDLFAIRLDPGRGAEIASRTEDAREISLQIETALQAVDSLDDDRVLRRLTALVMAITRTNFYQRDDAGNDKVHISFKVASRELADLPLPKPYREIFVSAPNVEGVHLRFGPVARGGLRWSDRRDDFRTEVLGLVKAQQVKNAVIVPVGSKGGFFPKGLPRTGGEAARVAVIEAYRTFLRGLLDLTDNLGPDGTVIAPPDVVIYDGEDPYLVVAADKGTATFSDIANGVAADYGYWLGDAFASGGSAGYDHKAMAITARGAWESVKRHFRELGVDIQREPVSVIGVGDMSGDVFGNGMLLSRQLKLLAAFDHRHIFLDPDPDPATAWQERSRVFALPRSSWHDYNRACISQGGGVFARSLKSIPLTGEVRAMLNLKIEALPPVELIGAILRARADLLYLGGIGTYVKSAGESNLDVGDKANDAVRINGRDLNFKVVGEGANLGFTQAARIEFALAGGRINTDAIDNSAGVDTSDHEVNIKILTGMAMRAGDLAKPDRDPLLASMTQDVGEHVLAHNYDQTLSLSILQAGATEALEPQSQFIATLERSGRLDRSVEYLPDLATLAERGKAGKGLVRPELAVLLAYGKLDLFDDIIASSAPDDAHFETTLRDYFPKGLRRFETHMRQHRLRREIISTVISNELVNMLGPTFPGRLRAAAGCDTTALITAFEAARHILRLPQIWNRISRLDGKAPASGQIVLYREVSSVMRGLIYWLARRVARDDLGVRDLIEAYQPAVDRLKELVPGVLSPFEQKAAVRRAAVWIKAGSPRAVAHSVALMRPLSLVVTLTDLATVQAWPLDNAAFVYHRAGGVFGFDKVRAAAAARSSPDPYERLAVRLLIEELLMQQSKVASAIMTYAGTPSDTAHPERDRAQVSAWSAAHAAEVKAARRTLDDIEHAAGGWTFAKLTIAKGALRELAGGGIRNFV